MVGEVIVVNKYAHKGEYIYIGRGSVFGNPFPVSMGREECIAMYRDKFYQEMINYNGFHGGLEHIINRVLNGETVYLGCFCKPKACHGDVIKEYIDNKVKKN